MAAEKLPPEIEATTCPNCATELVIIRVTPVLFASEFAHLKLACKTCNFAKEIKIRRG